MPLNPPQPVGPETAPLQQALNGGIPGLAAWQAVGPIASNGVAVPAGGTGANLGAAATQYPPAVVSAAQAIFAQKPDQLAAFQNQYGGNLSAWLNGFTQWWSNSGSTVAGQMGSYAPESQLLSALGYQQGSNGNFVAGPNAVVQPPSPGAPGTAPVGSGTTNEPAEVGIYDETIGGLNNEILNDANLQQQTQDLQAQNKAAYGQLASVLGSAIAPPGGTSQVTQQENAGITNTANTELSSLLSSIQAMKSSLTGTLAAQADALEKSIQQQMQNASTYGSQASQALNEQIQTQLGDLQTSIGSQKNALNQEIASLSGAADASSQAQLAALQTKQQALTAAEAPVADAVTKAAQAQVAAVNIGEAQAKNQIEGQQALQGFVGGSSELGNALSQSGISAAQAGAQAVGAGRVTNAEAQQAIDNEGAEQGYGIRGTLAQQQQAIADQGATGTGALEAALATGTQGLGDTNAQGQASIKNTVAGEQQQIGDTGAQTQYGNTNAGLQAGNALDNALAQGQNTITDTAAQAQQANLQSQYGQSLQAALGAAALPTQEAGAAANIDNLQNAGLLNAQNALNWWTTSAAPPNPTTTTQTASGAGNAIAAAGTGLLGAATSIGNSNQWWQSPTKTVTPTQESNVNAAQTQFNTPINVTPDTSITG